MKPEISEQRRRRLLDREKKPRTPSVPFRESGWLAAIYRAAFLALASAILAATTGGSATLPRRLPVAILGAVLAVELSHGAMKSLYRATAHRNTHLCLMLSTTLLSLAVGAGLCAAAAQLGGLSDPFVGKVALQALPVALPHFLAPAILTLLLGPVAGSVTGIGQSILLTMLLLLWMPEASSRTDARGLLFATSSCLMAGLLASASVPKLLARPGSVRRRSRVVLAAAKTVLPVAIGAAAGAILMGAVIPRAEPIDYTGGRIALHLAAGIALTLAALVVQAIFVAVLLPILEHIFAQTSDITLQNYADLASPLLERLALEAPGTYNHGIMVASLAAAAAEKIGANPLLARVGAYYHDIGKLSKPSFFTENNQVGRNPHDTLSPGTSASLLRSHVKDGIVLAERYRLPLPVRQIIEEHHGTTVMAFFLAKARAAAQAAAGKSADARPPAEVDEGLFRYPGPKPSSKESGILMLADSVEAATRSLEHATPSAIDSKVAEIINSKLLDGQFDDCPLTLGDIAEIRKTFTTSLLSILHKRIAYPDVDELREKPAAGEDTPPDTLSTPPARSAP